MGDGCGQKGWCPAQPGLGGHLELVSSLTESSSRSDAVVL